MNPIEVLLIFLDSEVRELFREVKNKTYHGLATEIFTIIEEALRRALAETYGISVEKIEEARVDLLEMGIDEVQEELREEDGKRIIIRNFSEFAEKVLNKLGVKTKVFGAAALLVAEPLNDIIGEAYNLSFQVALYVDGRIEYYKEYDLQKVPKYNGSVEIIAIPVDYLELPESDCDCVR